MTINYDSSKYAWRLPLGSLLPPQYDAQSGEAFPGHYIFSPFTGAKLTPKPLNSSKPIDITKPADAVKSAEGAKK